MLSCSPGVQGGRVREGPRQRGRVSGFATGRRWRAWLVAGRELGAGGRSPLPPARLLSCAVEGTPSADAGVRPPAGDGAVWGREAAGGVADWATAGGCRGGASDAREAAAGGAGFAGAPGSDGGIAANDAVGKVGTTFLGVGPPEGGAAAGGGASRSEKRFATSNTSDEASACPGAPPSG